MAIAREGYPLILTAAGAAIIAWVVGFNAVSVAAGLVTLALAGFFRDPERNLPAGDGLVVAPADGRVVSIVPAPADGFLSAGGGTRISIFLSPLDVHINRLPVAGEIEEVRYQSGKFLAAYKEEASRVNEQNALRVVDNAGRVFGVVQIAGVVARRIVCRVKKGDNLTRGERFGLIMFGSRTDTYLPEACTIAVTEGQRVKGGETILGKIA